MYTKQKLKILLRKLPKMKCWCSFKLFEKQNNSRLQLLVVSRQSIHSSGHFYEDNSHLNSVITITMQLG
jgi:hypothetical protein